MHYYFARADYPDLRPRSMGRAPDPARPPAASGVARRLERAACWMVALTLAGMFWLAVAACLWRWL